MYLQNKKNINAKKSQQI